MTKHPAIRSASLYMQALPPTRCLRPLGQCAVGWQQRSLIVLRTFSFAISSPFPDMGTDIGGSTELLDGGLVTPLSCLQFHCSI